MEGFDLGTEPGGVLELPESITGPYLSLQVHIAVGEGDRTIAYWMVDKMSSLPRSSLGCRRATERF